ALPAGVILAGTWAAPGAPRSTHAGGYRRRLLPAVFDHRSTYLPGRSAHARKRLTLEHLAGVPVDVPEGRQAGARSRLEWPAVQLIQQPADAGAAGVIG